jgi:hypothetical protein
MVGEVTYTEFRKDGWPLCPVCGEDELFAGFTPGPSVAEATDEERFALYVAEITGCYSCGWRKDS